MKNTFATFLIVILLLSVFSVGTTSAQEWKQISPLISTCADVKELLGVKECKFRRSDWEFPKYRISVYFSRPEGEWDVSKDTVVEVLVSLKEVINLNDFLKDSKDYRIEPESDLPNYKLYWNDKERIRLTVFTAFNDQWIQNIYLYPSKGNKERLKSKKSVALNKSQNKLLKSLY